MRVFETQVSVPLPTLLREYVERRAEQEGRFASECAGRGQVQGVAEAQKIVAIWNARQVEITENEFLEREGLS
jgi:hypothetical protein